MKMSIIRQKGFLDFIDLLIIENKISKAGYHNKTAINHGEIFIFETCKSINKIENKNPTKYEPESPKKKIFQKN